MAVAASVPSTLPEVEMVRLETDDRFELRVPMAFDTLSEQQRCEFSAGCVATIAIRGRSLGET